MIFFPKGIQFAAQNLYPVPSRIAFETVLETDILKAGETFKELEMDFWNDYFGEVDIANLTDKEIPSDQAIITGIDLYLPNAGMKTYRLGETELSSSVRENCQLFNGEYIERNGYAPIIIRKIDRRRYLSALETYQTRGNPEPYVKFMRSALNRSLKMMIDLLDISKPEPTVELLTIAKFAKVAGLPVSTVRYYMKEGKLKPTAYTASGYALFAEKQAVDVKALTDKR